jgi:uncharacterized protein
VTGVRSRSLLTVTEARRIALQAAGLATPRPTTTPNIGHVCRAIRSLGIVQIDAVNVLERAHLQTLFARLGPYDTGLVDRAMRERRIFEYWARMASFAPIEDFTLFRPRMQRRAMDPFPKIKDLLERARGYVDAVYAQVAERGPLAPADLDDPGTRRGPWFGWADGKLALEYLFAAGRVTVAYRHNFTRHYDLVERVIPASHREPELTTEEANRRLLTQAAQALGIGTARDIIDYYWLPVADATPALKGLIADGVLVETDVEGWNKPAFVHAQAKRPRRVDCRTLLNPFDPYMWNRERLQRLHAFHYRIEIYLPKSKRTDGYYVLPFLLGDGLQARVDLKADRATGTLHVRAAHLEPGSDPDHVARELATELGEVARWLQLTEIVTHPTGNLAAHLSRLS